MLAPRCVLLLVSLSSACAGARATSAEPDPDQAHSQMAIGLAEDPSPSPSCADLVARYRGVLASADGTCSSDADCAVYGGLDPDAICGGLTDRATADALTAIGTQADAAGCPRSGYSCPAIPIRCTDGACR